MTTINRRARMALALSLSCGAAMSGPAWAQEKDKALMQPGARPAAPNVTPATPGRPAAPGAAPGANGAHTPLPDPTTDDPEAISLAAFSEPVQLSSLVDLLARTMNINLTVVGDVPGTVVFNAPVSIKKTEFLGLVDSLLEQQGYTITLDRTGFYSVRPVAQVAVNLTGELPTTRVIATPNVRPSALAQAINQQLGAVSGGATGAAGTARAISFVDELGIIVVTDTTRRLDAIQSLVNKILQEYGKSQFIRIDLQHVAAPVALQRVLQLVGQSASTRTPGAVDPNTGQPATAGGKGALDNLGDRLTVDPQGNALVFRGVPDEISRVREALALIDKVSELTPKRYEVGNAAKQVADLAQKRGLGEVTTISSDASRQNQFNQFQNFGFEGDPSLAARQGRAGGSFTGGPVMVVDESRGSILYYGTVDQHTQMAELIKELDAKSEAIVIREYKLNHSDAEKMAELINGLIRNETPQGGEQNPLLPGGSGRSSTALPRTTINPITGEAVGEGLVIQGENAFVIADKQNSQLLVKAPAKQQPEFAKLIEKLDLRRPQVYVEAKIVAVTADDRLRLAFEQQLINAQGTGGVLNTNFGLGTITGALTNPKTVATGLGGFTAAIIKSDQVPIAMTALANNSDTRVIANPQLLVDDNEEAEVVSLDRQPTSQISRGTTGQQDIVTAGDYAEAGTTLRVTPQISSGGYLRLKYDIELSSFTGEGVVVGGTTLPPPQQKNNIKSASITIPSNFTVVVGGIVVDTNSKTIAKIPLLGDIPILGYLFGDHRDRDSKTVLYVFLTPRILRDPTFQDLAILSEGPQKAVLLEQEDLRLTPSSIDLVNAPARK